MTEAIPDFLHEFKVFTQKWSIDNNPLEHYPENLATLGTRMSRNPRSRCEKEKDIAKVFHSAQWNTLAVSNGFED